MNPVDFSDLKNKTCVITGGGGVIGHALAHALGRAGAKIAIVDLSQEAAGKVAKEIIEKYKVETVGVLANVLDKMSLLKAKEEINSSMGRINLLINGAG